MANISLEGSIRTCKVDTAWASKLASDRFMNPNVMMCPAWNGSDTSGRPVCADSYWTKRAGCNSAVDRLAVENELRPQYMEYITLDAEGIRGNQSCPQYKVHADAKCAANKIKNVHLQTGQFGYQTGYSQNIYGNCASCPQSGQITQPQTGGVPGVPSGDRNGEKIVEKYLQSKREYYTKRWPY